MVLLSFCAFRGKRTQVAESAERREKKGLGHRFGHSFCSSFPRAAWECILRALRGGCYDKGGRNNDQGLTRIDPRNLIKSLLTNHNRSDSLKTRKHQALVILSSTIPGRVRQMKGHLHDLTTGLFKGMIYMQPQPTNKKIVTITKISDDSTDFEYWKTQPYLKRLNALETIRTEYNTWKYGAKQRLQRVYRVTRRQ